ncbi:hypothetical protein [Arthrobacter sp. 31Y]|uniref:hypothetical protein n=1 Tax=Arthrobacter sp. 31Y TaxID=1115632 RepID=UPI000464629B|nr:hypothetical protein [Arthrobacter sp. 31Y]
MTSFTERLVEAGAPELPNDHWYAYSVSVGTIDWTVSLKVGRGAGSIGHAIARLDQDYMQSPVVADIVQQAEQVHRQAFPEANFRQEVQVLLLGAEVGCELSE